MKQQLLGCISQVYTNALKTKLCYLLGVNKFFSSPVVVHGGAAAKQMNNLFGCVVFSFRGTKKTLLSFFLHHFSNTKIMVEYLCRLGNELITLVEVRRKKESRRNNRGVI
jgi:hypothetical protein